MPLSLLAVDHDKPEHQAILYGLLALRPSDAWISHAAMPTWQQHCTFVASRPYAFWYLVREDAGNVVGSAYVTARHEIGVSMPAGIGGLHEVLKLLRATESEAWMNVAPNHENLHCALEAMGARCVQMTYRLGAGRGPSTGRPGASAGLA